MISDRERFLALLYTAPLLPADAIVVLAGEDADVRASFAAQLYRMRPTPLYVTGGRHEPPRHIGAEAVAGKLMGHGVLPSAITTDDTAQNTREQADGLAFKAAKEGWRRILLVASGYHLPRAYLTVQRAIDGANLPVIPEVIPVAAWAPWSESPPGITATRAELLDVEFEKIDRYRPHVARYDEGISYLTVPE